MQTKSIIYFLLITLNISACTSFKTGKDRVVPDLQVQLKISSLHAKKIQEQGLLGTQDGDEPALLYSVYAYNQEGSLISVNNGFWGVRTISQDALILADEFEKIAVRIPEGGKIIAAFSLIEIDDYKGERRIAKVKNYTRSERYPKMLSISAFDEDRNLSPLELVAKSLKIAGYKKFVIKHMDVSINDDLGGTKQVFEAEDLQKINVDTKVSAGKETFEIDGSQINENYLYVLKYDIDVMSTKK